MSGSTRRAVVSEPVNASWAAGAKIVAHEASITRVENVGPARLVGASLLGGLVAGLSGSAREQVVGLADKARVALRRFPHLPSVVAASLSESSRSLRTNVCSPTREEVDCFTVIVRVEAFREVGSERVALLASVAVVHLLLFADVGGERAVVGVLAVQPGVALTVVTRLAKLAKFGHVLAQADSRGPGSVICVLAVHSVITLVPRSVEAGLALTAHRRSAGA